jgi:outer membrane protein TolC
MSVLNDRQKATGIDTRETEIGVSVPLWLPGQRSSRQGQSEAESAAAAAGAALARLRIAGAVRELAAEVALQRAEVAAAQASSRELEAVALDVERRVAAGDLARADALAAQAERLAAGTALAQARQRLQAAERQWQALTGLAPVPELAAAGTPLVARADVTEDHPALQAASLNTDLARKRLEVVKASRRDAPELLVRGRQEVTSGEPNITGVGLAIRIPFGTADRNEPLLAAALAELDLAEATERERRLQLEAELAQARAAREAAGQQLADEATRARLLRERAGLIEKSFQAGQTALPDLLRALAAAAQAEAHVLRQRAMLAQASLRLEQALGVLP